MCIETELLGPNLLDLIKDFRYQGCPLSLVKAVARAALEGLAFLHGRCRVIHTDIKPENILLTLAPRAGVEPLEAAVWWTRHSPSGCKKCKEKAEDARGLACEARWKLRKGWTAVLAEGAPGGGRVGARRRQARRPWECVRAGQALHRGHPDRRVPLPGGRSRGPSAI